MRARLTFLIASLLVVGCKDEEREDVLSAFRASLPDEMTLAVAVPDEVITTEGALEVHEGSLALPTLRDLTRVAHRFLEHSIVSLLDAFRDVTALKPLVKTRERIVWWTPTKDRLAEALVVVQRDEVDGHFTFTSWLRDHRGRGPWKFLAFGTITPGETSGDGRGALWINLDNDRQPLRTHGKVVVLWSEQGPRRDFDVRAFDASTDEETPTTRGFRYHEDANGGVLAFDAGELNVHLAADLPGLEKVRVITRWDANRRFRSDAISIGPEINASGYRALLDSQCWHAQNDEILYSMRVPMLRDGRPAPVPLAEEGSSDFCPFAASAVPVLPATDDAPTTPPEPPETDPDRDWGD